MYKFFNLPYKSNTKEPNMKKLYFLLLTLISFSAAAQQNFKTGSLKLDTDLNKINVEAEADFGAFQTEVKVSYDLSEKKLDYMHAQLGMSAGDIFIALEISKIAKVPLDDVLASYSKDKSKGWGYIAKQMGIKPGSPEFHQLKNCTKKHKGKQMGKKQSKNKQKHNK